MSVKSSADSAVAASYRTRIYERYVKARLELLAPSSVDGLKPRAPYLMRLVKDHFPKDRGASILELGCGHGALIYMARRAGYRNLRGIDASIEQVEAARRLRINGIERGEIIDTLQDVEDGTQDCVVTFDVIEHFTKSELVVVVDEIRRVLADGGRWIIHVPNSEGPFGGRMRDWDFTHEISFTRNSIMQLLKASGFAAVQCFEDRPVAHGLKSVVRAVLWKVIRALCVIYLTIETGKLDRGAIFSQNLLAVAVRGKDG